MHTVRLPSLARVPAVLFVLLLAWLALPAPAQSPATGTIEGRVSNATTGAYLRNARVSVDGTRLEALTDEFGDFQITGAPVGAATLRIFYTGLPETTQTVNVTAGSATKADVVFGGPDQSVTKLDAFVVASAKETNPQAIAINEQRFAANIKNVVSADEFGSQTEGNVGEFAKYLPGVTVDYVAADARTISVRGFPAYTTPITVDGNRMAAAASSSATRVFEFEQASMNNVARVEVTKTPTPDLPADSMGGSVNLVSKSAFERSRPEYTYRVYESVNGYKRSLEESPGPVRGDSRKVRPGGDFTVIYPLSKNFGFTLSGLTSRQYNREMRSQDQWAPTALAATAGATVDAPALLRWTEQDGNKFTDRDSFGLTADWRPLEHDVVSAKFQYSRYDAMFADENFNYNVGTVSAGNFSPTYTHGDAGKGSISIGGNYRRKSGFTWQPSLSWTHTGQVWALDGGGFFSRSQNNYRDFQKGFVENPTFTLSAVTIRYDDIDYLRPRGISVSTAAGAPVDEHQLSNYNLTSVRSSENYAVDVEKGAHLNAARDVELGVPVRIKVGADVRQNDRDIRYPQQTWTASPAVPAGQFVSSGLSAVTPPYSIAPRQWFDSYEVYDFYAANPSRFTTTLTGATSTSAIFTAASNSKKITETIPAFFARGDAHFLDNRMLLVAGVRFEKTMDRGEGLLNDPTAIYVKDANGKPTTTLITTDPVQQARLLYKDRGFLGKKSYQGYYPSANLSYNVTKDLIARLSYAKTMARPDYSNIIPTSTIAAPSSTNPNGLVTLSNPTLNPWTADNYDASLEYYFSGVGVISASGFYKDINNFFGTTTIASANAATIASLGLDPSFVGYDVSTRLNAGSAHVSGYEFNYKQGLTFFRGWASYFNIFANATFLRLQGATTADFANFVPRTINWGIAYAPRRFNISLKWNYKGTQRLAAQTGAGLAPGTYQYVHARLQTDLDASFAIDRHLSLFLTGRNLLDKPLETQQYAPLTPAYARNFRYENYGAQWAAGIRGAF